MSPGPTLLCVKRLNWFIDDDRVTRKFRGGGAGNDIQPSRSDDAVADRWRLPDLLELPCSYRMLLLIVRLIHPWSRFAFEAGIGVFGQ